MKIYGSCRIAFQLWTRRNLLGGLIYRHEFRGSGLGAERVIFRDFCLRRSHDPAVDFDERADNKSVRDPKPFITVAQARTPLR
jgi:hypothetical protein